MILPLAFLIDWIIGDPAWLYQRRGWSLPHPIVLIGRLAAWVEKRLNHGTAKVFRGSIGWFLVVGPAFGVGWLIQTLCLALPFGFLPLALIASAFLAFNSLALFVGKVATGLAEGIETGRAAVSHIVGRDPDELDGSGVARASIESLAENFSDGVIAPLFWFAVGGLPGLIAYKAINTLDSMWGYRSARFEHFGKVAARLDDVANWIPARLSAGILLIACTLSRRARAAEAVQAVIRDANKHNSPNAGWPESAMAGGLGLLLAGPRQYDGTLVDAPYIGARDGRADLNADDIQHALQLYRICGFVTLALCFGVAMLQGALRGDFFFFL